MTEEDTVEAASGPAEAAAPAPATTPATTPATAPARPKLWTPTFALLILISLLGFLVSQGLNTGTSVFLDVVGYGSALSGVLAMIFSFTAGVVRLVAGPAVDKGHTKSIMIVGSFILVGGTFLPALDQSVVMLVVTRVLQGVGFAIATTAASAAATVVLPQERLGEGIGYHGLGTALANSVGPAMGLWLVGTDPATNLYLGMALTALVGVGLAFMLTYEKHPEKLPATSAYRMRMEAAAQAASEPAAEPAADAAGAPKAADAAGASASDAAPSAPQGSALKRALSSVIEPKAMAGAVPHLFLAPSFGFCIYFLGVYGTHLGIANCGLFFTISAVMTILVRLNSGRFMDSVAPIKILTAAIACGLLCYGMLLVCGILEDPTFVLLAAGVPHGLMCGLGAPANQTVAIKNSPKDRYGAATAMFFLALDLGIGVSSVAWGLINDAFGFHVSIILVLVDLVVTYIIAWIFYPARDKQWRK